MKRRSAGFTVIELMIVVSVMAVIAVVAVPTVGNVIANTRITTQVNEMASSLHLARSEAIKRSTNMTLCKSSNGSSCTNSGNWAQGWIVFTDTDGDGVVDTGETIVRVEDQAAAGSSITGTANVQNRVTFNNRGFARIAAQSYNGTLTVCDGRGASQAKGLNISLLGRVSRTRDSNNDGTEEDASGNALACP